MMKKKMSWETSIIIRYAIAKPLAIAGITFMLVTLLFVNPQREEQHKNDLPPL